METHVDTRITHEQERLCELDTIRNHVLAICKEKYGHDFGQTHPMYAIIMGNLDTAYLAQVHSLRRLELSLEPIRVGDLFVVMFKIHVPNLSGSGAMGATLEPAQHFTVFYEEYDEDATKHKVVLLTPMGLVTTILSEVQSRIAHGRIVKATEDEIVAAEQAAHQ